MFLPAALSEKELETNTDVGAHTDVVTFVPNFNSRQKVKQGQPRLRGSDEMGSNTKGG